MLSNQTKAARRVAGVFAMAALVAATTWASEAEAETLRLSHQWSTADVRHKAAQIIADHVEAANVDLKIQIFPSKSLLKPREQWNPLSRGQLDMVVFPLAYAGGQHPAFNLTLMPGLVKNHDHAVRLDESPFMAKVEEIMNKAGVMTLTPGWLSGGFASKKNCILVPDDVKGQQARAAGKAFERMLIGAGASINSMPSSEIYTAMQTGVLDAANTSSASFVSYRLYEQVACFTPPGDYALWFMYQPVLMSKKSFDKLNEAQQTAIREGAKKATAFYRAEAKKQDLAAIDTFKKAGVEVAFMDEAQFAQWRALAKETSYKAFVEQTPDGQALLDLALGVE